MKTFGDLALFPSTVRFVAIVDAPQDGFRIKGAAKVGVVMLDGQLPMYTSAEAARALIAHFTSASSEITETNISEGNAATHVLAGPCLSTS